MIFCAWALPNGLINEAKLGLKVRDDMLVYKIAQIIGEGFFCLFLCFKAGKRMVRVQGIQELRWLQRKLGVGIVL